MWRGDDTSFFSQWEPKAGRVDARPSLIWRVLCHRVAGVGAWIEQITGLAWARRSFEAHRSSSRAFYGDLRADERTPIS